MRCKARFTTVLGTVNTHRYLIEDMYLRHHLRLFGSRMQRGEFEIVRCFQWAVHRQHLRSRVQTQGARGTLHICERLF